MNVEFSQKALLDIITIHGLIAEHDSGAADRVISRIRQVTETLALFPLLGRLGDVEGTRELVVAGLPYTVIYRQPSERNLQILAVIHQRMKYPPSEE